MNRRRHKFTLVVALIFSLGGEQYCHAQSTQPASDKADSAPAVHHPVTQDPKDLEVALVGADPAEAARLLWRFSCANYSNSDSLEVVRRAWELRESSAAAAATRDPVVRTLMAKCLAEAWPRFRPSEPGDAPVLAQLRLAIGSDNPDEVQAAAFGLTQTATAEDMRSIVAAAVRLPAVAVILSSDLWQICRLDAIEGARKVSANVMDDRQRASIEANEQHMAATQRLVCEFDANIAGKDVSPADIDDFWAPGHPGPLPSVDDIRSVLSSTDAHAAREMIGRLRCLPSAKGSVELIRTAWRSRSSRAGDSITRDPDVRLAMAVCLAEAAAASNESVDQSVMEVLRQAVGGADPRALFAGLAGLSRVATAADLRLIEDSVKGRSSVFATVAVGHLTRSCAPGAERAAEEIRERTSSPQGVRAIEYEIGSTQRVRESVCAAQKRGAK